MSECNKLLDAKVYNLYNSDYKNSFEKLLVEGIRQANLKAIYKQIIIESGTPGEKECSK